MKWELSGWELGETSGLQHAILLSGGNYERAFLFHPLLMPATKASKL